MTSINTDLISDVGDASSILEMIAKHGFTHIHWCYQWCTDFLYGPAEIEYIKSLLEKNNLSLHEIHASMGREKLWFSDMEYQRLAGVELVSNRMNMAKELGGDVIVLHPYQSRDALYDETALQSSLKSLHELYSVYKKTGVKIAIENMPTQGTYDIIEKLFKHFPKDFLVYCWDTGHSNIVGEKTFEQCLQLVKERLYVLHLNDNEKILDDHMLPFDGTCDWDIIAKTIAASPYPFGRPYTMEVALKKYSIELDDYLAHAIETSKKITSLIESFS